MNKRNKMRVKKDWITRLEIKYGKYSIEDLMRYMSVIYVFGFIFQVVAGDLYTKYLSLNFEMIFQGQVWRLVTFILYPPFTYTNVTDVIWLFFGIMLYLWIGRELEMVWGTFRFNLYYFSGLFFCVLGGLIGYLSFGNPTFLTDIYTLKVSETATVNMAMFLAFAVIYPNKEILLFLVVPVKMKWLGILDGLIIAISVLSYISKGDYTNVIITVLSMLNFLIFIYSGRGNRKSNRQAARRKKEFVRSLSSSINGYRHKCSVCQRTEVDNPELEFRFCSKCEGSHEYCMEHIFTHEHVKRFTIKIDKDELQ